MRIQRTLDDKPVVTKASENGVAVAVIQKLARHSSLSTTQRYIEVSDDKLYNAVNAVSY